MFIATMSSYLTCSSIHFIFISSQRVETNMLDYDIVISEFELKSYYSIHFRNNVFVKGMNT